MDCLLLKKDKLLLFIVSTLFLIWTSIPNWVGYSLENDRLAYGGAFFDAPDYAVHLAMIRAGMQGQWAYEFRFTTEPHQAGYIRLFYIILGELNRIFRTTPEWVFQAARWIWGYAALFSIFGLIKRIFPQPRWQWVAFCLAVLGSGLGWLQLLIGWPVDPPVDFWLTDAYVYLSLAIFPHFAFTLALMCIGLTSYLDYLNEGGWHRVLIFILAAIMTQFVNPIAFVLVDIAIFALSLFHWRGKGGVNPNELKTLIIAAIAQLPLFLYNFLLLSRDPIWSQFTAQNQTLSPSLIYYLSGFGLFLPLAMIGIGRAWRGRNPIFLACASWILAAFILAYAPFAIQRRFLLGITIPLSILATNGLIAIFDRLQKDYAWSGKRIVRLSISFILIISVTSLMFFPGYSIYMLSLPKEYFYPRTLDRAFTWISQNSRPDDVFFSAERTGQLIAQKTGRRVFLGHIMETLYYDTKVNDVKSFYQGTAQSTNYPVQWIFYGPYEQTLSPSFEPGLDLVYSDDDVRIYKAK